MSEHNQLHNAKAGIKMIRSYPQIPRLFRKGFGLLTVVLGFSLLPAEAQVAPHPPVSTAGAGGNTFNGPEYVRYQAKKDIQDRRIDMFIGDWHESLPRRAYGSLILRDVLTKGNNFAPPEKGAVLESANFLAYGRLPAHESTIPSELQGVQEVYYIFGGTGEISAGDKHFALHKDIAILMPAGLSFTMTNTGDESITMYVVNEPVPAGFHPIKQMLMADERTVPVRKPQVASPYTIPGASGHWAHIVRDLFNRNDGLATIGDIITVEINPISMGEPHPHQPGHEEIWAAIDGTSLAFIGAELRVQTPGMAYMLRPDGLMQHSNINAGDAPVKFLWFSTSTGFSGKK
ncbi:cupin domain-containing protein [Granulicella sp. dw_53]|uniref:cupin domain-containing protein n=1 Tax=Granulicella sp. dw_53 TaxID=2719792 RepID=UPI001BD31BBE|nr:cupin domain-containing protein [Granulicella sp. dw_53]